MSEKQPLVGEFLVDLLVCTVAILSSSYTRAVLRASQSQRE